ncbi:DUF1800 family protein [Persicirhabdus sediminis]|nr:DUF1800 family protein [Persicirhabdus sediminis]
MKSWIYKNVDHVPHFSVSMGKWWIVVVGLVVSAGRLEAILDLNGNGVSDVWEHKYHATELVADSEAKARDADGDGLSNYEESIAGTNPFDSDSGHKLKLSSERWSDDHLMIWLRCETQEGKAYQLVYNDSLGGMMHTLSAPISGYDGLLELALLSDDEKQFYQIVVTDLDSDTDGLSDWEEIEMENVNYLKRDTYSEEFDLVENDYQLATMLAANEISWHVEQQLAVEKEQIDGELIFRRSGAINYAQKYYLKRGGLADVTKSAVSELDYRLLRGGQELGEVLVFAAGESEIRLQLEALPDQLVEVPEFLQLEVLDSSCQLRICDATIDTDNSSLYLARLRPENGALSGASGVASILVQGDNDSAKVYLNFSGLGSAQTTAHLHVANPVSGPPVLQLPLGKLQAHPWPIRAAHFLINDQMVLDALREGRIYINVHSVDFPAGEIRGDFQLASGALEMPPPPPEPVVAELSGEMLDFEIARFLTQATFGPTPQSLAELREKVLSAEYNGDRIAAYSDWIDEQMALPQSSLLAFLTAANEHQISHYRNDVDQPYYNATYQPNIYNREIGWWIQALSARDQLRQRMAAALEEIIVVSRSGNVYVNSRAYGHCHYYDMLAENAFSSYDDLLKKISIHPMMGIYLSSLKNRKAELAENGEVLRSPDENYAREILQLFSIGLYQLHPNGMVVLADDGLPSPSYEQSDIRELARVFTGWSFSAYNSSGAPEVASNENFWLWNGYQYYEAQWVHPMKQFESYHDDGAKKLFEIGVDAFSGEKIYDLQLPAGLTGEEELDQVIAYLSNHQNTAPFITRRLIQRLVTSNPSEAYVHRVASVWLAHNGDLGEVLKAILLDYEARTLDFDSVAIQGKKKEPMIHFAGLARMLEAKGEIPMSVYADQDRLGEKALSAEQLASYDAAATAPRLWYTGAHLLQNPLAAPSVFNWFSPDHSPVGELSLAGAVAPEFQLIDETQVVKNVNYINTLLNYYLGISGHRLSYFEYPPYSYSVHADHLRVDFSVEAHLAQVYLSMMDTNGDNMVSPLDTTFNNRAAIVAASEALVDEIDLYLCAGWMKRRFGVGYQAELSVGPEFPVLRQDNARDLFIHTVAMVKHHEDGTMATGSVTDETAAAIQHEIIKQRIITAVYLISTSSYSMNQH